MPALAKTLTNTEKKSLEGTTLTVYLYALNNGKPVDIRDVMKGIGLSSPTSCTSTYRSLKT